MPDYGEILSFLAANPPQLDDERELHASLLELLAKCMRQPSCAKRISSRNLPTLGSFDRCRWSNAQLSDMTCRLSKALQSRGKGFGPWHLRGIAMGGIEP